MKLIRQLDENWKTQMDDETFNRLVRFAVEDIKDNLADDATDNQMEDVVWNLIDNVPGFEQTEDAVTLFTRVMDEVRKRL